MDFGNGYLSESTKNIWPGATVDSAKIKRARGGRVGGGVNLVSAPLSHGLHVCTGKKAIDPGRTKSAPIFTQENLSRTWGRRNSNKSAFVCSFASSQLENDSED